MIRVNLVDVGSQPYNVLGTIYNQIQAEITDFNLATGDVAVKFTLFTTAEENNPGESRTVTFSKAQYNSFGFSKVNLLAAARTALNLP